MPQVVLVPFNTADGEHTSVLRKANKAEVSRPALEPSPPQRPACDVRRATRSVRHAMQSVHAPAYKRADPSRAGEQQGDSPHAPDTMRRAAGFARGCKGFQRAIVRGCNVRLQGVATCEVQYATDCVATRVDGQLAASESTVTCCTVVQHGMLRRAAWTGSWQRMSRPSPRRPPRERLKPR